MSKQIGGLSKLLSLVLRHDPGAIGLTLDGERWADVDHLIECANASGARLTQALPTEIVSTNDKQRFSLTPDLLRTRARQGHPIKVDLNLDPVVPAGRWR